MDGAGDELDIHGPAASPQVGYRHSHGDRPLEGYTIERALGRGGFGEVYFARSDGGREVALKAVQGYEAIELRGVSQCMNLKSPHLVTIFDVRHNDAGRPFVIMEHVAGPSLRQLLDQAPDGLGPTKGTYFLREIAKGLTYLHDCGIVHRDLKPANIFYEDGYVKIGDYGLSKAISTSHRSGQTVTVGTVHYMAPEIGQGRYDRSVDIYALGAIFYEMLTGTPPYQGDSVTEILMKHLSAPLDLAAVAEPHRSVIARAMDKDPAKRYATVQEMVEAVFGAQTVRTDVSVFAPGDLSMVAGRAAGQAANGPGGNATEPAAGAPNTAEPPPRPRSTPPPPPPPKSKAKAKPTRVEVHRHDRAAGRHEPEPHAKKAKMGYVEPLGGLQRLSLAMLSAVLVAAGTGLLTADENPALPAGPWILLALATIAGCSAGVLLGARPLGLLGQSRPVQWIGFGGLAAVGGGLAALVAFRLLMAEHEAALMATSPRWWLRTGVGILLAAALLDWGKTLRPQRKARVSLDRAILAALLGGLLAGIFDGSVTLAVGTLAGVSLTVQAAGRCQWDHLARPARKSAEPAEQEERS